MSLALFESFDNGDYIDEHLIKSVINYILMNLYSYTPSRRYWEQQ